MHISLQLKRHKMEHFVQKTHHVSAVWLTIYTTMYINILITIVCRIYAIHLHINMPLDLPSA